ncbi:peptide synthetase [Calothrix brevissima NIES-22]|nr:peptide synthetase [Calothrix brevissima NIES-22]
MKNITEFLAELCSLDVKLWVEDNRLRCSAPKNVLTPTIREELARRKQDILNFISNNNSVLDFDQQLISSIPRAENLPLSFAQQRLWFLAQLEPDSSSYNISVAVRLQGKLNLAALQQSFQEIINRHEALRTSFQTVDGQPIQIIAPSLDFAISIISLDECSLWEQEKQIRHLTTQAAQQPFDLTKSPLLRVTLVQLHPEEYIILLTIHHIVSDAWSMGILVEEFVALYSAFCQGKPSPIAKLPIQYADFAVWQRQWLQGERLQTQINYWKQKLGNIHPQLKFPRQSVNSTNETTQGAEESFTLSQELSKAIYVLSRQEGVTLFMTLLAAFEVLLYCFTGTLDIRVGSPIANRNRVEIEKLIGFFVNTLVLRIDLSGNPSFRELLARSHQVTLEAYAHQDLPFEKLVEELQPQRSLNNHPLYQAWFVLDNNPMPQLQLPDLILTPFEIETRTVRHDLLLSMWETSAGLQGYFEYKTHLFDKVSISRLIEQFQVIIQHVVAKPEIKLQEIVELLNQIDREQQQIKKNNLQATERQKLTISKRRAVRNI